jgi:hypothetical protein
MNSPDEESKDMVPAASLREYSVQLAAYLDGQGSGLDTLRSRTQPNPPWPETDNPMLGYLIARANEILVAEGAKAAIVWLAVHSWFEGSIEERAKLLRSLQA